MLDNEQINGLITKFLSAFLHHKILLFLLLCNKSQHYYTIKNVIVIIF